jgi:pyruvate/2-oxoglutarate dehydrogenase complex dihydrolipoamide acyltransferase (E2) component
LPTGCAAEVAQRAEQGGAVKDEKPAYKLSVNDMVIKALALALRDVPDANVSWTDETWSSTSMPMSALLYPSRGADHADRAPA